MFPLFNGASAFDPYGMYGSVESYGTLNLTEASPAQIFEEPVTVEEARSYLKIPVTGDDPDILALLSAARVQAEILQGRDLVRKQWDFHRDYWPNWPYRIRLRDPLIGVDLVQYRDSTGAFTELVEGTDYVVDTSKHPGSILPPWNQVWPSYTPWPSSSLLIRYRSGFAADAPWWANTGALVKAGIRKLVSLYFFKRVPFSDAIANDPVLLNCLSAGSLKRVA